MTNIETLQNERLSIIDEMEELNETSASIKDQIAKAKDVRATTGEYADPDWFRRATFALRATGRDLQGLQSRLGDVNREIRKLNAATNDRTPERKFIYIAKRILAPSVYWQIWSMVAAEGTVDCDVDSLKTETAKAASGKAA